MEKEIKIPNISNYIMEIVDDTLILTSKLNYITESDMNRICLLDSIILSCKLNNEEVNRLKYKSILISIYKKMTINSILQNTLMDMKLIETNEDGYIWYKDLRLSIQNKDSNFTFKEIMRMVKLNEMILEIEIQLKNKEIIYFIYK
jgi:hypothetical protein